MANAAKVENLNQLLDTLVEPDNGKDEISLADVRDNFGGRSFGPFLLVIGLFGATPASGIPGFPTIIAVTVLLTAGQMVIGLSQIWLPQFMLCRAISRERLERIIGFLRWPASLIDRVVRPRIVVLTKPPFAQLLGVCCCLVAVVKPPLELIPATSALPAAIIALFGLALTAHDGAVAIVALVALAAFYLVLFAASGSMIA
jgi:hypothetical protein